MSPAAVPLPAEEFERLLLEASKAAGVPVPAAAVPPLARYLAELDRWRRVTNLTGDLSGSKLAEHTLESLVGSPLIPGNADVIDIGSGAGFPGVPLAIVRPDIRMTLLEPRTRRAAFLRHVVRTVPVATASVLERRVESLVSPDWSVATERAVGDLGQRLGEAPFLVPGGRLLLWTTEHGTLATSLAPIFALGGLERLGGERRVVALFEKGFRSGGI